MDKNPSITELLRQGFFTTIGGTAFLLLAAVIVSAFASMSPEPPKKECAK